MKLHRTKKIAIKIAPVDIGIVPVVRWLNRFDHVFTAFSCQGDDAKKTPFQVPYVLFYCTDSRDLMNIVHTVHGLGHVQVDFYESVGSLRYCLNFVDGAGLRQFIKEQRLR